MKDFPGKRRSLTHVGGRIETEGTAESKHLAHALEVAPSTDAEDDVSRAHVHGFHTYPARMHPATAGRLVRSFTGVDGRVLDPFCGSGTVLVEAVTAGRTPFGTDLNPLAVLLSRCKTRPREPEELQQLMTYARECAEYADARRKAKAGASRRLPPEDAALFEPHVLLELDSLRAKIETLRGTPAQADLYLVLSALLVKLSRKRGDTSEHIATRRTAPGFAAKQFVLKAEDLVRRLGEFRAMLPTPPPRPPFVEEDDATRLRTLANARVDAVITSPPYAATYDYSSHHALRLRWLGLNASGLHRGEMGSRTAYRRVKPMDAAATWARELAKFLTAVGKVIPKDGPLVMLMADSAVGDVALRADEIVAGVAREYGFFPAARASQPRPHFHGPTASAFRARPRAEHAILLIRR
jgi:hypothetical protein